MSSTSQKGIVYCVVAKNAKKLETISLGGWNNDSIVSTADNIVRNTPTTVPSSTGGVDDAVIRKSYEHDGHGFNYTVQDEILVLCVSSDTSQRKNCFTFLESVRRQYALTEGGSGFKKTVLEWMVMIYSFVYSFIRFFFLCVCFLFLLLFNHSVYIHLLI